MQEGAHFSGQTMEVALALESVEWKEDEIKMLFDGILKNVFCITELLG